MLFTIKFRCLLLIICIQGILSHSKRAVYNVEIGSNETLQEFTHLSRLKKLDVWQTKARDNGLLISVMIEPDFREAFELWLKSKSIKYNIIHEDIDKLIKEQDEDNKRAKKEKIFREKRSIMASGPVFSPVGTFATLEDINKWLDSLARRFEFCEVITIGKSYEERDLKLLKISPGENKSIVFIDSGIHSREWLAPASAIYTIEKIITHILGNTQYKSIFEKYEYHFVPVANPDGYAFTFLKAENRLWRKNRKPYNDCIGVDLNRNFDVAFGEHIHITGSGHEPCDITYHGPHAFSEPETASLRDYFLKEGKRMKFYMTVHCCADSLILPYTFSKKLPNNIDELRRVGKLMVSAMESVDGYDFRLGTGIDIFKQLFSGISMDWVFINTNTSYAYVLETKSNFLAPVSSIYSSGEEVYQALRTAVFEMNGGQSIIIGSLTWLIIGLISSALLC